MRALYSPTSSLNAAGKWPIGTIVAAATRKPWPIAAVAAYDVAARLKLVEDRRQRTNAPLYFGRELTRNALARCRYAQGFRPDPAVRDEIRTITRLAGDPIDEAVLTRGDGVMVHWSAHRDNDAGTIVRYLEVINDSVIHRRPRDRREAETFAVSYLIRLEDRWASGDPAVVRDAFPIRRVS